MADPRNRWDDAKDDDLALSVLLWGYLQRDNSGRSPMGRVSAGCWPDITIDMSNRGHDFTIDQIRERWYILTKRLTAERDRLRHDEPQHPALHTGALEVQLRVALLARLNVARLTNNNPKPPVPVRGAPRPPRSGEWPHLPQGAPQPLPVFPISNAGQGDARPGANLPGQVPFPGPAQMTGPPGVHFGPPVTNCYAVGGGFPGPQPMSPFNAGQGAVVALNPNNQQQYQVPFMPFGNASAVPPMLGRWMGDGPPNAFGVDMQETAAIPDIVLPEVVENTPAGTTFSWVARMLNFNRNLGRRIQNREIARNVSRAQMRLVDSMMLGIGEWGRYHLSQNWLDYMATQIRDLYFHLDLLPEAQRDTYRFIGMRHEPWYGEPPVILAQNTAVYQSREPLPGETRAVAKQNQGKNGGYVLGADNRAEKDRQQTPVKSERDQHEDDDHLYN